MKSKLVQWILPVFLFTAFLNADPATNTSQNDGAALVSEIFIKRHSGKDFDEGLPVSNELKQALIEATRWTPSSFNDQPWNFILCDRNENPEAYYNVLSSIFGNQESWLSKAPVLVVIIARTNYAYNNKPNDWAAYDTGAAAMSMSLQATDLGLMTHQIGGFDREQIRQTFLLPDDHDPLVVMAIGYEVPSTNQNPRIRKPASENFFNGEWGIKQTINE